MTIYLDAVWMLNFLIDLMLLMLVKLLARDSVNMLRLLFGALIASFIVPITIFYPESFINGASGKLLYSVLIIFSAFGWKGTYQTLKLCLLFYFVSFAIGGGLTAIHFMLSSPVSMTANGMITFNKGFGDPISWLFIFIGFPIIWYFTKRRMDEHAGEQIKYDQMCEVSLTLNHKIRQTTGYIDSGNQLIDPLTKRPVIICDRPFLSEWFTENEWFQLENAKNNLEMDEIPKRWQDKIQIIPYQGVDGGSSMMIGIRPERVIVNYNDQQLLATNVIIGIQFGNLVRDNSYHCLLHPQIMKKSIIHSA
ncbi:sigma-E processing peptidase SpoIIGA [Oceanobacillus kimchii]|uniref:sigma-E processing peptidase SpoIIGA n=1 Tax=Oceanobacillus kimchii TaxID=746691 RepID=UPI0021A5A6C6|nr:sigma-E processing peptidase SpoIIGA [Oceanobacillus kimchii]MCT1576361.1 sigma-E processing peptidase SpoIIGA [Oceanobacillus kimchii]MCT2135997.1 sigma-E processing peptidase SpoIIGA [Oceanobacillus kimchii]